MDSTPKPNSGYKNKIDNTSVTVVTPCLNEEEYIEEYLDSIVTNAESLSNITVLIIDGGSRDNTIKIISKYREKHSFIKLIDYPDRIQTLATNLGFSMAEGDYIIRMDVHSSYPPDFITKLLNWIKIADVDCVGGLWRAKSKENTLIGKANAIVFSSPFGVGNSHFRTGISEPRLVDTVPQGCYKKEVFERIGYFNHNLDRTDDIEFNIRLRRSGGKLLLVPDIESIYYCRATLTKLAKQNYGNGFWITYSLKFVKRPFSTRHLIPLIFVGSLIGSLAFSLLFSKLIFIFFGILVSYFLANILFSLKCSIVDGLKYFPFLLLSFSVLHFSYGLGSIHGLLRIPFKPFKLRH